MKKIILNIEGIECSGCENRIQNAVSKIEGIENVIANHEDVTLIINAKENVNENEIKEKIEDLGFMVKD